MRIANNRTQINGQKTQQPNSMQQQGKAVSSQQQLQQQINYSNSTSNLNSKRDYLSPSNRLQQGNVYQNQQQQQHSQLHQQQYQMLQQQQQQVQPQKNNFFQQNGPSTHQTDSQNNMFQGGYAVQNQQSNQNQMINQDNRFGKQPQTPSQQQQQYLSNQAMRPSSREGYTVSTQSSTINSNRQQIRASTSNTQLDNRLQRNSYSQQNLKNNNITNSIMNQNSNDSQMKENMAYNHPQQDQYRTYKQQNHLGYQQGKNPHMYHSGIVQTNSQIGNHNMKRSEIIEMKHSNYLNSPNYPSQYNSQIQMEKEIIEKKENYTLFPENGKDKQLAIDSRTGRQNSQYKDSSINNTSNLQLDNSNSNIAQRKELQRVQSATTTSAQQNMKRSSNFEYKTQKNSKLMLQNDSQTPKSVKYI